MTQPDQPPEQRHTQIESGTYIEKADTQGGDLVGGAKQVFHAPVTIIQQAAVGQPAEGEAPVPGEPPYMGLCYFDVGDEELFFGRETLTAQLVGRLRQQRFLAVVGASGSGKSSVVRAGVVPALLNGEELADGSLPPEGSPRWPVHIITPTAHPLEALAASLTRDSESVTATATLIDDLAKEARSLHLYARKLLSQNGGERLLLVVDQFEELFTACKDAAERQAFVDNLMAAVAEENSSPTVVIITLRADFYHHCAQYDNLRNALAKCQEYIGAMKQDELRRAIEAPAEHAGWAFEPGLVDLMLRDVGADGARQPEPGALPLLSHALLETWKRRRGRTLTLAGYHEAGGVHGAIAKTAERVYTGLSPAEQVIARNIFLRLTELGEGTQDTRRRAALEELSPNPAGRAEVDAVLSRLADSRLVTTSEGTAEVAHEALIREWPTLRNWLDEDREALRVHRHLTETAQAWQGRGRDPGELYRGARLAQAVSWAGAHAAEMSALEGTFLKASREALRRERRVVARTRWAGIAAVFIVALLIVVLAATGQLDPLLYGPVLRPPIPAEDWVTIPAGEFLMGSDPAKDSDANGDEMPQHTVYLDAYRIMRYEVTNQQYRQCERAEVCSKPRGLNYVNSEYDDHPVVFVTWFDAQNFCEWVGGRLPTEAEWEKAARGVDGRTYPWGDALPDCSLGIFYSVYFCVGGEKIAPVGSYPDGVSPYGLYDMAGNVYEWVNDWYQEDYYSTFPANGWPENPTGPDSGDYRVLRGGSWGGLDYDLRVADREGYYYDPSSWYDGAGIRCAALPGR